MPSPISMFNVQFVHHKGHEAAVFCVVHVRVVPLVFPMLCFRLMICNSDVMLSSLVVEPETILCNSQLHFGSDGYGVCI